MHDVRVFYLWLKEQKGDNENVPPVQRCLMTGCLNCVFIKLFKGPLKTNILIQYSIFSER